MFSSKHGIKKLTLSSSVHHLGRQLAESFARMPTLKRLCLIQQPSSTCTPTWTALANAPAIPCLEGFEPRDCDMDVHDYATFILNHIGTLKFLCIQTIHPRGGCIHALSKFCLVLSESRTITDLYLEQIFIGDDEVPFPSHLCWPWDSDCEEAGYVDILLTDWIAYEGHGEVKVVLLKLAEHLGSI